MVQDRVEVAVVPVLVVDQQGDEPHLIAWTCEHGQKAENMVQRRPL